jgi:archaellum component FlaC
MANDHVMTLDKQLAALEITVAKGFQEQRQRLDKIDGRLDHIDGRLNEHTGRFDRLDDRISALDSKLDVVAESIRGEVTTIRELVTGFMGEMRRTTDSIRQEHAADRRLTRLALADQVVRIRKFEGGAPSADN